MSSGIVAAPCGVQLARKAGLVTNLCEHTKALACRGVVRHLAAEKALDVSTRERCGLVHAPRGRGEGEEERKATLTNRLHCPVTNTDFPRQALVTPLVYSGTPAGTHSPSRLLQGYSRSIYHRVPPRPINTTLGSNNTSVICGPTDMTCGWPDADSTITSRHQPHPSHAPPLRWPQGPAGGGSSLAGWGSAASVAVPALACAVLR